MVLSGRRSRRIGTRTWLAVGILVTLLVLLVDASIKSRSAAQVRTLSNQGWVDQVLPILGETISQGDEINQLRQASVATSASTVLPELQGVVANATEALNAARALKPPVAVAGPNGLLLTCLQTRVLGAQTLSAALNTALTGTGGDPVGQMQKASQQFEVADQAYALFTQDMPPVGVALPASVWLTNPGEYTTASLTSYIQSLRNARSPTPVHELQVQAVTTLPPAVSTQGKGSNLIQILPQSNTISVMATVGNIGNQAEDNTLVTASLQPSAPGFAASVAQLVSLQEGQSQTITLPVLRPPVGVTVTLTVTIGGSDNGQTTNDNTKSIAFVMPASNSVVPTTPTSVPASSTTAAGAASGATGSGSSGSTTATTSGSTSTG